MIQLNACFFVSVNNEFTAILYIHFFNFECYFFPVWVEFKRYSLRSPPPNIHQVKGVRLCTGEVCALVENNTNMSNQVSYSHAAVCARIC